MRVKSWLCASTLRGGLTKKALDVGADIALFDLEDSVPAHQKREAREEFVRCLTLPHPLQVAVRVNSVRTEDGLKDVLALLERGARADCIVLPKARLPGDVELLHALLVEAGQAIPIFAVVESVASLWDLKQLGSKPDGLSGLIFGSADFATDVGLALESANLTYARTEIALHAKRLGVVAIDSPCFQLNDRELLTRELEEAKSLGYAGKIAVHPAQIPQINATFTPTRQEVERAEMVLNVLRNGDDGGIARIGGSMVGPPFAKQASKVLASATAALTTMHVVQKAAVNE